MADEYVVGRIEFGPPLTETARAEYLLKQLKKAVIVVVDGGGDERQVD